MKNQITQEQVLQELKDIVRRKGRGGQAQLARDVGLDPATVSYVLSGKIRPSKELLEIIGVEVEVKYLYRKKNNC